MKKFKNPIDKANAADDITWYFINRVKRSDWTFIFNNYGVKGNINGNSTTQEILDALKLQSDNVIINIAKYFELSLETVEIIEVEEREISEKLNEIGANLAAAKLIYNALLGEHLFNEEQLKELEKANKAIDDSDKAIRELMF